MVKKKSNEIIEEEIEEHDEDVKPKPDNFEESLEDLEEPKAEKTFEDLFNELDKKIVRLEKGMVILQKWLKKNSEDIERNTDNFAKYIEQK